MMLKFSNIEKLKVRLTVSDEEYGSGATVKNIESLTLLEKERIVREGSEGEVVDLIRKGGLDEYSVDNQDVIVAAVHRTMARAHQEDELWTPIMDAIGERDIWPDFAAFYNGPDEIKDFYIYQYFLDYVEPWIRKQKEVDLLEIISESKSQMLRWSIASNMIFPDIARFRDSIRSNPDTLLPWAMRSDVPWSHQNAVLEAIVAEAAERVGGQGKEPLKRRKFVGVSAIKAAVEVLGKECKLSQEQKQSLVAVLPEPGTLKEPMEEDRTELFDWQDIAGEVLQIEMMERPDFEVGQKVFDSIVANNLAERLTLWIRTFPQRGDEDWEWGMDLAIQAGEKMGHHKNVIHAIAGRQDLRNVTAIRPKLLEELDESVALELIADGREGEWKDLFVYLLGEWGLRGDVSGREDQHMLPTRIEGVVSILERDEELAVNFLERQDIEFLLRAGNREARALGILLIGRMQERKQEVSRDRRVI